MSQFDTHQHELRELLHGSAGGRALVEQRGSDRMKRLGALGGSATYRKHGSAHMRSAGALGGAETRKRLYSRPADVYSIDGTRQRRIPYYPPNSTRRRRRPIFVYIEVSL